MLDPKARPNISLPLDPDRLYALFEEARALNSVEREALVERERKRDPELATRLQELLQAQDALPSKFLSGHLGRLADTFIRERGADISEYCLDRASAVRFLTDPTPQSEAHLDTCSECRRLILRLARARTNLTDPDVETLTVPSPGEVIGRYVIVEELGRGGMGVVMSVRDPVLDRKVALKLVRPDISSAESSQRLLEEAKTLAKVAHPNVITVHDAGRYASQVFVAMELISGQTLAHWLGEARTFREIAEAFIDAGEGLNAAHAVGVVHGDFKPANVLVGPGRRIVVTDFGLARWAHSINQAAFSVRIGGTPGYMAPEQYRGQVADVRTDQFSFCVALYEALWGNKPDQAQTPLSESSTGKTVVERRAGPPSWIRSLIRKGLHPDPEARHPSMRVLVDALSARLHRRRRWQTSAALSAVAVVGMVATFYLTSPVCDDGGTHFDEVWGPAKAGGLKAAFSEMDAPYSAEAWRLVNEKLAGYRRDWIRVYREVCEQDPARKQTSTQLQHQCLSTAKRDVASLVSLLNEADAEFLRKAPSTVSALLSPNDCARPAFVSRFASGLVAQEALSRVQRSVTRARTMLTAADYRQAQAQAQDAFETARLHKWPAYAGDAARILATAQINRGRYDEGEDWLYEALSFAERAGAESLRARILIDLAGLVGLKLSRRKEGRKLNTVASALLERLDDEVDLRSQQMMVEAAFLAKEDRIEESIVLMERVLARRSEGHPRRARTLLTLGNIYSYDGKSDRADTLLREGLKLTEEELGSEHPRTANALMVIAKHHAHLAEDETSLEYYSKALGIWKASGVEDANVATALARSGYTAIYVDQFALAMDRLSRALELRKRLFPPGHPDIGTSLLDLAALHASSGHFREAVRYGHQGVANYEQHYQEDHATLRIARTVLAEILRDAGEFDAAEVQCKKAEAAGNANEPGFDAVYICKAYVALRARRFQEALALFRSAFISAESLLGKDHPELHYSMVGHGLAYLALGQRHSATVALERALELLGKVKGRETYRAKAKFALAQALGSSERAIKLAQQAEQAYASRGRGFERRRQEILRWLKRH